MKHWPTRAKETHPISEHHAALFWAKVEIKGPDECWPWKGHIGNKGYGQFTICNKVPQGSHRVAYALKNGTIPAGANVCHRCDNPICCNPAHHFLGSQKDNIRDMGAKGRHASAERNGNSKMTAEQIRALRADYEGGERSFQVLGPRHGCSDTWAAKVVRREVWKSA